MSGPPLLSCSGVLPLSFVSPLPLLRSFLDDLYRIAHRGYEPTDDDVVRARLRTMGVQEYRFLFETGVYPYFHLGYSRT